MNKDIINLEDLHLAQAIHYVEAYNLDIGLLINFGATSLQFKRVHYNVKTNTQSWQSRKIKIQTEEERGKCISCLKSK